MPLYEFDCPGCGRSFEKLVRSAAAVDQVVCPVCGNRHVKKKLSTFAVRGCGATSSATGGASCAPSGG